MWFPAARKPRGNSDPCLHWTVQIPLLVLSVTSRSPVQAPASAPVPGRELRAPLPCQSHLRAPLAQTKDLYPERALKIIVQREIWVRSPSQGCSFLLSRLLQQPLSAAWGGCLGAAFASRGAEQAAGPPCCSHSLPLPSWDTQVSCPCQ